MFGADISDITWPAHRPDSRSTSSSSPHRLPANIRRPWRFASSSWVETGRWTGTKRVLESSSAPWTPPACTTRPVTAPDYCRDRWLTVWRLEGINKSDCDWWRGRGWQRRGGGCCWCFTGDTVTLKVTWSGGVTWRPHSLTSLWGINFLPLRTFPHQMEPKSWFLLLCLTAAVSPLSLWTVPVSSHSSQLGFPPPVRRFWGSFVFSVWSF